MNSDLQIDFQYKDILTVYVTNPYVTYSLSTQWNKMFLNPRLVILKHYFIQCFLNLFEQSVQKRRINDK